MTWAMAACIVVLMGIATGASLTVYRWKLVAASEREVGNMKFLAGERERDMADAAVDAQVKLVTAYTESGRQIDFSGEISIVLESLLAGHDPSCAYCNCGHSEAVTKLGAASEEVIKRHGVLVDHVKRELRQAGWIDPGMAKQLMLLNAATTRTS